MSEQTLLAPAAAAFTERVKSPLNYVGGKFKLLPQLAEHLPDHSTHFIDAFGGGGNVVANFNADRHHYNDINTPVVEILRWLATTPSSTAADQVRDVMNTYGLNDTNKNAYLNLRAEFNNGDVDRDPWVLYALLAHAFNNVIRFNSKGGFNVPFGERTFSKPLRERFVKFADRLASQNLTLTSDDYPAIPMLSDAFVYCDPPYLVTVAPYNQTGGGWSNADDERLYEWLDALNEQGIGWALSNVLEHHGQTNTILEKFAQRYTLHDLTHSYSNAFYSKRDRASKSREVLVTNR